jgi:hypothetical protein
VKSQLTGLVLIPSWLKSCNCTKAADPFACLVAVDSVILNQANDAVVSSAFYGTYVFVPVVDGTFGKTDRNIGPTSSQWRKPVS